MIRRMCLLLAQVSLCHGAASGRQLFTFWISSQERLKGFTPNLPQMFLMRSRPSVVTFQVNLKSNMSTLVSDWLTHFELLKNGWRDLLQTCHKCSLWGPDQVLLLLKPIWNPIQPPWPLIGWHIFNVWKRMAEGIYSKLATNVPYDSLTKCLSRLKSSVAALLLIGWHT